MIAEAIIAGISVKTSIMFWCFYIILVLLVIGIFSDGIFKD